MYTGPHTIKDGLVFGYDTGYGIADNVTGTRFYPGEPVANMLNYGDNFNSWTKGANSGSNPTVDVKVKEGPFKNTLADRLSLPSDGSYPRIYQNFTPASTATHTFSVWLKGETPNQGCFVGAFRNSPWSLPSSTNFSITDEWVNYSFNINPQDTSSMQLYIGSHNSHGGKSFLIYGAQLETGSTKSVFIDGTRSSTQSLIDLKETTDIDVSNVSFDSTGQPIFDGTDDILYANAENDYPYPHHSWEVWFKTNQVDSGGTSGLVGLDYGRTMGLTATNGGNIVYTLYSNMSSPNVLVLSISGGTNLLDNKWHQVVCSRGTSAAEIWVDGSLVQTASNGGQATWNGINQWSGMAARFGDNPNNTGLKFTGQIPIIKIYNKQLSGAEVLQNYNAQKSRFGL